MFPSEIENLIDKFGRFPGIGPKTAQRFVFYLLKKKPEELNDFAVLIGELKNIFPCFICGNFSSISSVNAGHKICPICFDKRRDQTVITLVAEPQDLVAIEKTGEYKGLYHVLGGLIDMVYNLSPEQLKIQDLMQRLRNQPVKELIFALNATIEGESTVLYIANLIKKDPKISRKIILTRIARGIPLGGEIEYADEITLSDAFKNRKTI